MKPGTHDSRLVQDTWLKPGLAPGAIRAALPYQVARSALFAGLPANLRARKVYTQETEIASVTGFKLFQRTGRQLTQAEETLWLELLKLAFKQPDEPPAARIPVYFTANGMLKTLGKTQDSKNRAALRASLNLLGDARVRVERADGVTWTANLIDIGTRPTATDDTMAVFVDRAFATCFAAGYTLINLEQRRALKGSPLAQWMHGYYSTHRKPLPIHASALQRLAGCESLRAKAWISKLARALTELEDVTGWVCEFNGDTNIVKVDRGHGLTTKSENPNANAARRASNDGANDPYDDI